MSQATRAIRAYQSLIVSAAILLVSVTGIIVGAWPATQKIIDQFSENKKIKAEVSLLQRKADVLDNLDEDSLRNSLDTVLSAVPGDKSLPSVLGVVEGVAQQAGVSVVSIALAGVGGVATTSGTQSALEKQLGTRVLPFAVTVEGPVLSIHQFIQLAPSVRRLLRIRTFSIAFPKDDLPLRITLQMDAFYEPFPKNLGNLSTPISTLSDKEDAVISQLAQFPLIGESQATLPPPTVGVVKSNPFSP